MSIKKSQIEDKSISPQNQEKKNKENRPNNADTYQEFNYPGQVTIKAKNKKEADEKFNKLNNK